MMLTSRPALHLTAVIVLACASAASAGDLIYGIEGSSSHLFRISSDDGTPTFVGDAGEIFLGNLVYRPSDGFLYGINAINLVRVNPADANATVVGPHGLDSLVEGGMAISSTGVAFAVSRRSWPRPLPRRPSSRGRPPTSPSSPS